ncbi:MAG TPA: GAF domain-containing protein [bacterium]|nr:GAF domain-containing protein [bacterium]
MRKELRICTAIRDKEYEDRIVLLTKSQGWKHSLVNVDDIVSEHRRDGLFFIVEDSYSSILDLIEIHNSCELNFIPVIVLSGDDSKHSNWIKRVKYSEKYFHAGMNCFPELMVQSVKTMDALRDTYYYKKISDFRENTADAFKNNEKFSDFLSKVLPDLLELLYTERGSIMLLNGKKNLVVEAATKKELVGIEVEYKKESVAWTVIDTQKPVFVENIENDSRFKKMTGYSKDYFLSLPIFVHGEISGVLNLSDKVVSLLFDTNDYNNATNLLSILEPYLLINKNRQ